MANTIDNFILKVNVEGTAQIKGATQDIQNLDKATTTAGKNMGAATQNIRNIGFQVQDFAVQVSNGTSAVVALSQQLPQLLSGFGTLGIYIGVVAAALPAAIALYKAFGGDTRNLDERIKDLTDSVKAYHDAQRNNIPTLQAMGTAFGSLTDDAKRFYDFQERLTKFKARFELIGSIQELKDEYKVFTSEFLARQKEIETNPQVVQVGGYGRGQQWWKEFTSGLSTEQLKFIADAVKNIDVNKPEETARTFEQIRNYLEDTGVEAEKVQKFIKNTLDPILKINEAFIEFNRNVKEAGDRAVKLGLDVSDLQAKFLPQIGAARRSFDQVGAARLESEFKVQNEILKLRERTDLTSSQKALMLFTLRKQASIDLINAEQDIAFQRTEQYKQSLLQYEATRRQIFLEQEIVKIRDQGVFSSEQDLRYQEDLVKNAITLESEFRKIDELRRKGQITGEAEQALRLGALDIQQLQDKTALLRFNAEVRKKTLTDEMEINKKVVEDQISRQQTLDDVIRGIKDQVRDLALTPTSQQTTGLNSLQRQFLDIEVAAKRAAIEKGRVFSAKFEGELTPEKTKELADGLQRITDEQLAFAEQQKIIAKQNYEYSRSFDAGWADAFAKYVENAKNAADQAQSYFDIFTKGIEDAIVRFVQTGKLSFKDLANNIIAEFVRIQVRSQMMNIMGGGGLLSRLFGGFGGIGFGTGLGFGNLDYGGFFAKGGTLGAGKYGIAGEAGPELVTGPATITPMSQLAPSTNITYNINAVDASSFRALVARDPEFIYSVTEAGRRKQPTRRLS